MGTPALRPLSLLLSSSIMLYQETFSFGFIEQLFLVKLDQVLSGELGCEDGGMSCSLMLTEATFEVVRLVRNLFRPDI